MIRFRFKLRPIAEVAPWGGPTGPANLHWFGLTDGWYWIEVGSLQLLRYSRDASDRPAATGGSTVGSYADYYVARLREDLLEVHRAAVEPVPDDLDAFLRWRPEEWPALDDPDAQAAEAFSAVVAKLHDELMATMEGRVAELEREGAPPGVKLDLVQLRAEQRDRVQWLARRAGNLSTDWARVRRGASLLINAEP